MKRSALIIPLSILAHLAIINTTLYLLTPETYLEFSSIIYYNLSWVLIAVLFNFYPTARKETFYTNLHKPVQQFFIYGLGYFAWLGFKQIDYNPIYQLYVIFILYVGLTAYRWLFYSFIKFYRSEGGNSVNVIVVGRDRKLKKIRSIFDRSEFGYRYMGYFDNVQSKSKTYLGPISNSFSYILENDIDEVYCMVSRLTYEELQELIHFADNNLKKLKIIPDNKEIYTRAMNVELYGTVPVFNLRKMPLDTGYGKYAKRAFDLVFSSFVIIFLLSWLTPLIFIIMNIESRGPLFFRQKRHGFNKEPFWCYKFRSMTSNDEANSKMSSKDDNRITRIGKILRKTSIDELPQFYNVFFGDMSVVGPRPHMEAHTRKYENSVDKYLVRHFVKPGITGLAQIRGYRGEILDDSDIINRVRLDIFYLEKWSVQLDLKIIYYTVVNAIRGEEKAY
tara:strand:- start:100569 stop:101912 length:1344 start_codon:yes stop_codon:yes gene_type:complete